MQNNIILALFDLHTHKKINHMSQQRNPFSGLTFNFYLTSTQAQCRYWVIMKIQKFQ